jgi:F0F1-type ATP synthase assembly protein I
VELREKVAGFTRAAIAPTQTGELYNGAGEGMSRAMELALTPAIIGGFGYLLDRWLGLVPVLTIVFFLVAMVGLVARLWYSYDAQMTLHEQAGPWAQAPRDAVADTADTRVQGA